MREEMPLSPARERPRLWHHDYLHLRPLLVSLRERLAAVPARARVLDLGCGASPYRGLCPAAARWVRVDLDPDVRPHVLARGERLPFADGLFDVVLSTQILGLVDDPWAVGHEVARVLRRGGVALVSAPAAWPYDSAAVEHRWGVREIERVFPELAVREVRVLGGMLGLPFALLNVGAREAVRSAERRFGRPAAILRAPAAALFLASNLTGRTLEILATGGPLAPYLSYLDGRLPTNLLVVAERA
ncbi:MAG TPA: class I SAM-dependent methyltransferase [Candidatus Polarisedimenticolaceae bacterium]|nr:class I SAM-dependent methyltransferase [Candidatus Polarisedimenticolaceae bacterium]